MKNTTQHIVARALEAMENYYEYGDYNHPSHAKDGTYPLRTSSTEGDDLSLIGDGDVPNQNEQNTCIHCKHSRHHGNDINTGSG